jgi:putative flippase GtrA
MDVYIRKLISRNSAEYFEFIRYLVVGGTAFIVDYGLFYLTKNFVFTDLGDVGVYLATALGFIAGLIYNYVLSIHFVFNSAKARHKGRTMGAFMLFVLIGIIGLLMSEGGMYLFYGIVNIHYMIAKILVSGIVLIWNYVARKLLIFR